MRKEPSKKSVEEKTKKHRSKMSLGKLILEGSDSQTDELPSDQENLNVELPTSENIR